MAGTDNVVLWPKNRGQPLVCGRCKQPIVKGQEFALVRVPEGEAMPVHGDCMKEGSDG